MVCSNSRATQAMPATGVYSAAVAALRRSQTDVTNGTQLNDQSALRRQGASRRPKYEACRWPMLSTRVRRLPANGMGFSTCRHENVSCADCNTVRQGCNVQQDMHRRWQCTGFVQQHID